MEHDASPQSMSALDTVFERAFVLFLSVAAKGRAAQVRIAMAPAVVDYMLFLLPINLLLAFSAVTSRRDVAILWLIFVSTLSFSLLTRVLVLAVRATEQAQNHMEKSPYGRALKKFGLQVPASPITRLTFLKDIAGFAGHTLITLLVTFVNFLVCFNNPKWPPFVVAIAMFYGGFVAYWWWLSRSATGVGQISPLKGAAVAVTYFCSLPVAGLLLIVAWLPALVRKRLSEPDAAPIVTPTQSIEAPLQPRVIPPQPQPERRTQQPSAPTTQVQSTDSASPREQLLLRLQHADHHYTVTNATGVVVGHVRTEPGQSVVALKSKSGAVIVEFAHVDSQRLRVVKTGNVIRAIPE